MAIHHVADDSSIGTGKLEKKKGVGMLFEKAPHLSPEDVLIIGDSLSSDILGGNNAGIDACWMNAENKINDTAAVPTYEIHKLAELYDILGIPKK